MQSHCRRDILGVSERTFEVCAVEQIKTLYTWSQFKNRKSTNIPHSKFKEGANVVFFLTTSPPKKESLSRHEFFLPRVWSVRRPNCCHDYKSSRGYPRPSSLVVIACRGNGSFFMAFGWEVTLVALEIFSRLLFIDL